jgi:hypothetical protein
MKIKFLKSIITVFAVMMSLMLAADTSLPRPIMGSHKFGVKFTVSGYEGETAVANLPVLVKISPANISGFSYSDLNFPKTGEDICFIDLMGNALPFEIDTWDATGTSYAWVILPSVEQGTEFVMCYGSDVTGKTLCPDDPWSDYVSVWHMESTNPVDHAAGNNDGTGTAGLSVVDGISGSAVSFSGVSNEGVSCGTNLSNANLVRGFTFQSWVNFSVYGDTQYGRAFFGKDKFISIRSKHRDNFVITTPGIKDHEFKISSQEDYLGNVGVWNHIVISFMPGSSGAKIYLNGKLILSQSASDFSDKTNPTEMWLGRNQWGGQEFKGVMDEARLSKSILSAETIAATYAAQMPETFLTVGMLEMFESEGSKNSPVFRIGIEEITYTELTFSATCLDVGLGASSLTADVQLASDEDFNSIVETKRLALNGVGAEEVVFSNLTPGAVYYARVVSVNNNSNENISIPTSQSTYSPAPAFRTSLNYSHIYPEISISFIRLGMANKVNKIVIQASSTGDFTNPERSKSFDVDVTTDTAIVSGFLLDNFPSSSPQYYRVIAYNDIGESSFVDIVSGIDEFPVNGNNVWSGLSENVSDSNAYVYDVGLPEAEKTLYFTMPAESSPIINEDTVMPSLSFTADTSTTINQNYFGGYHSCGYNLSGTGVLIMSGEKPITHATYGTNVISNPIIFSRNDNQSVSITSIGENNAWLYLDGDLMLPEGVSNTTFRINGRGNTVLGGNSQDFMGQLSVDGARLSFASSEAMTNVSKLYFSGDPTTMENLTGKPLVFPRMTKIYVENGWPGRKVHLYGAPFVFPQATFEWAIRDYNDSYFEADVVVSNVVVRQHSSNSGAYATKKGAGAFIVTGETSWYNPSVRSVVTLKNGCFYPQTAAGLPPSGEFYTEAKEGYATLGLNRDYAPMLDGSSLPRILQKQSSVRWGFTGFGGDRTVCWNNDSSFNVTNTASDEVSIKMTNTGAVDVDGLTYDNFYAYPSRFMFGNRSEFADGTIIFMNPIRYELGQYWDTVTYFESTNHVVAARLRGSLKLGSRDKTWIFSGNNFGGYLALEAENTDFTGRISVSENGNLLVNSNLVARSITVQSGSGLGGTGNISSDDGINVSSGAAIFGGEWNKGGTLIIGGKLTFEANSAIRAEVGSSNDLIGCIKLAPESVLKLSGPVYVDVDTDPSISPVRGTGIKILDWSEATFDSGAAPTVENFVPRVESNSDISKIYLSTKEDGLYMGYVTGRVPDGVFIFIK